MQYIFSRVQLDYTPTPRTVATDIDLKCVHMAYIQTSLYGIPAVIIHGDSLTVKEWSHWFTPALCMVMCHPTAEVADVTAG